MSNNTQNCSIITISGSLWWCQHKSRLKYLSIHKPVLKTHWCSEFSKERWNLTFKLLFSIAPLQLTELPLSTDSLGHAILYNWAIGLLTFNQSIKFHKLNPHPYKKAFPTILQHGDNNGKRTYILKSGTTTMLNKSRSYSRPKTWQVVWRGRTESAIQLELKKLQGNYRQWIWSNLLIPLHCCFERIHSMCCFW